ncbi:MAG: hypothetical protein ACUZ77_10740, partial [Candidatus Brocadiales bacterium]
ESEICPNQAFRYGKNAYGIQFHIEVTEQMIQEWTRAYKDELDTLSLPVENRITTPHSPPSQGGDKGEVLIDSIDLFPPSQGGDKGEVKEIVNPEDIIKGRDINYEAYTRQAKQFYSNFFRLAGVVR